MSLRKLALIGLGVVAVATYLAAQTSVRLGMLSGPVSPGGVMVLAPNGQVTFATIGPGIVLTQAAGGGYTLQMSLNRVVGAKPARQADGSYLLLHPALAGSLRVFRNGVRQSPGDDYTFDSAARKITPAAGLPWDASDLMLVDYEY